MKIETTLGVIGAAGLLCCISAASAQTPGASTCGPQWCVNNVVVTPSGANLEWKEIRMEKGVSTATILWMLYGGPDDEFRADSVVFTGANAMGAKTQFPLRQVAANRYAVDNLNTSGAPYTYEVRIYKKGAPSGTTPVSVGGSVVNAPN